MIFFLLFIFLAFPVSWLLTRLTLRFFLERHWLDNPNHRSAHKEPIPTSGGLGFATTFLVGCLGFYAVGMLTSSTWLASMLLLPLMLLGLIDDRCDLSIWPRLGVQALVMCLILISLGGIPVVPLGFSDWQPGLFAWLPAVIALVWFLNLYNFMDGIDGIAIVQALFVSLACVWLAWMGAQPEVLWLACLLFASGLGFLCFNLPPARLFMGDTGSYFLGGACVLLGLMSVRAELATLWTWLILVAPFVVDATLTLFSRICRGQVWYHAHSSHAYQHAARLFSSHARVLIAVILIDVLWLLPFALLTIRHRQAGLLFFVLAYLPLCLLWYGIRRHATRVESEGKGWKE